MRLPSSPLLLVGAGYLLGSRRARSREVALKTTLDEQTEKLTLVEHELLRHSAIDPVTGLHTQQHFQEFLEREWRRASRERKSVAVIMIEVDHFRAFNERQGKPEGDACLKSVADAIEADDSPSGRRHRQIRRRGQVRHRAGRHRQQGRLGCWPSA